MKTGKWIYCLVFFAICLCPTVGMLFAPSEISAENRRLSEFPALFSEEGINVEWLSRAGEYFEDHFAFRNEMVTANALIYGRLLKTSAAEGVIQGTDGWLYYKDSLNDYLGDALLSERSLYNIAHTLSMVQKNLESRGIKFLFTVAPNKNTLYGEHMPYYYRRRISDTGNLDRLLKYLAEENVKYADLYEFFSEEGEVLYHQRDSHWNNKGAALACDLLLTSLGKEHTSYLNEPYQIRCDFRGDLDVMLYPVLTTPEEEIYYEKPFTYAVVGETESNFDPRITTVNPSREGSLVMYRDSFGNALLPFLAEEYARAFFSRGVPYQLSDAAAQEADTVIIERAERFLPEMAQSPPVLEGTRIKIGGEIQTADVDGVRNLQRNRQGTLTGITGVISLDYLDTDTNIYVRINKTEIYEAFPMDIGTESGMEPGGFCLYLPDSVLEGQENTLEVLISRGNAFYIIYQEN